MPSNIKTGRRYWNQRYSLVRAHSASADTEYGGNSSNDYTGRGSWAPNLSTFSTLNSSDGLIIGIDQNTIEIHNEGSGEVYTTPFEGLGAIVCETDTDTTWEFSVGVRNVTGDPQNDGGTVEMFMFGLDSTGARVGGAIPLASGSEGGPSSIPSNAAQYRTQITLGTTSTPRELKGTATLNNNSSIRYVSLRLDVNAEMHVEFSDLKLQPLDLRRSQNPLIWNSPRYFQPKPMGFVKQNLRWGIGSTEDTDVGNGDPIEYLRIDFNALTEEPEDIIFYLEDQIGLKGFRYGPDYGGDDFTDTNNHTGGTEIEFPSNYTGTDTQYVPWTLHRGASPSSLTGPDSGIPTLPQFADEPMRRHYGYKRGEEPQDNLLYEPNYLYTETSSPNFGKRFVLQLPKINFNATTRQETLSFYYYANGSGIGNLSFHHQTEPNSFYLPGDGTPHASVGNVSGEGVAAPLTSVNYFNDDESHPDYPLAYEDETSVNGRLHDGTGLPWYRVEVDISELRGRNTHIIILYDDSTSYYGDVAISNILISGQHHDQDLIEEAGGQQGGG